MSKKLETICAQTKQVDVDNVPIAFPIYQTSTFEFRTVKDLKDYLEGDPNKYEYTRYENPTLRAVQEKIAELEKGEEAFVFASGMAAITSSILAFLKSGDEVIASDSLYGRTQIFMERWLPRFNIKARLIPQSQFPDIDRFLTPQTKLVYIESPTNPTLRIIDIRATAERAHRQGALLLIDNTFATPINQNPIELGADIVLHSATKAMGGHSDLIAGVAVFSKKHEKPIREALRTFGGCMDPLGGFLLERGLKTLAVRVARQNQTAGFLVQRLAEHPAIQRVNYPGLKNHPGHDVAARQMRGFGTMFSFDLPDFSQAARFIESLKLLRHAASLGGPETLVTLPVLSSHYGQPPENWKAAGITDGTVRISVGLEDPDELWNDIETALRAAS